MRIVVVGGSAAGLWTAVLLARAGHDVVVVERDDLRPAADVETAAAGAFRASAPQIVQPHVLLPACRDVLHERSPDLYKSLLDAGVVEAPLAGQMPPGITDRAGLPGDEWFTLLMTRRATVDWVLARAAAAEPNILLRYGTPVTGLVADPGDPPRVRGVRTRGETVRADLVVDAAGRRSPVDRWLAGIGARPATTERAECGLAYYGRQYRARTGALPGPLTTRLIMALDEFVAGIWGGDNGTMQLAIAPLATDRRFTVARHPETFTAILRSVPFYAAWLDCLDPISDVCVMGGLHNTLRRLVVDGTPAVLGLHAVGDTVCTTNPTFARGLGMAARTVAGVVDAVDAHPDDLRAQAVAVDRVVAERIAPWYADQAVNDAGSVGVLRHVVDGTAPPAPPPPERLVFGQLRAAAQTDAVAFRALWRVMGMVGRPSDVYDDPVLTEHVHRVLAAAPLPRPAQPTRAQLVRALATDVATRAG